MSLDRPIWPTITPDFECILRLGGHRHILRPADQRAAEYIVLAETAESDIVTARTILSERSSFLVAEQKDVMDARLTDTQEALHRVANLLSASRMDQDSDSSVRFNPQKVWVLDSQEPKAAATFGRLQTTHNLLKTVIHDLNNIEPVPQHTSDETGKGVSPGTRSLTIRDPIAQPPRSLRSTQVQSLERTGSERMFQQPEQFKIISGHSQQPIGVSMSSVLPVAQQDPKHTLALKRSIRGSRHMIGSSNSSISTTITEDHHLSDPRTPVSHHGHSPSESTNTPPRPARDLRLNGNSLHLPEVVLPAIHELESTDSVSHKEPASLIDDVGPTLNDKPDISKFKHIVDEPKLHRESPRSGTNISTNVFSAIEENTIKVSEPGAAVPAFRTDEDSRRGAYGDYRQRNRKSRIEPYLDAPTHGFPPDTSQQAQSQYVDGGQSGRFEPTFPKDRRNESWNPIFEDEASSVQPRPRYEQDGYYPNTTSIHSTTVTNESRLRGSETSSPSGRLGSPTDQLPNPPAIGVQQISQNQPQRSVGPINRRAPSLHFGTSAKSFEIHFTEPTVPARVPTQLRVGRTEADVRPVISKAKTRLPYPVSEAGSDGEEVDRISDMAEFSRSRTAFDRSATIPQMAQDTTRAAQPSFHMLHSVSEETMSVIERSTTAPPVSVGQPIHGVTHQRNLSENAVPQPKLTRENTIPRKAVARRSLVTNNDGITNLEVTRATLEVRPVSQLIRTHSEISQLGISSPPSPLLSDDSRGKKSMLVTSPHQETPIGDQDQPQQTPDKVVIGKEKDPSQSNIYSSAGVRYPRSASPTLQSLPVNSEPLETLNPAPMRSPPSHKLPENSQKLQQSDLPANRKQYPNPLAMHPHNRQSEQNIGSGVQSTNGVTALSIQPAQYRSIQEDTGIAHGPKVALPDKSAEMERLARSLPQAQSSIQRTEFVYQSHPNRSHTLPEPGGLVGNAGYSDSAPPRRASEQGITEILQQKRTSSDVLTPEQQSKQLMGQLQGDWINRDQQPFPHSVPRSDQDPGNAPMINPQLPMLDGAQKDQQLNGPTISPGHDRIVNPNASNTYDQQVERRQSTDRELFGQRVWSPTLPEMSPQLYQTQSAPQGYFPGQRNSQPHLQQPMSFPQQPWRQPVGLVDSRSEGTYLQQPILSPPPPPQQQLQRQHPMQAVPIQYTRQQQTPGPQQIQQSQYQLNNQTQIPGPSQPLAPPTLYQIQQQAHHNPVQLTYPIQHQWSVPHQVGGYARNSHQELERPMSLYQNSQLTAQAPPIPYHPPLTSSIQLQYQHLPPSLPPVLSAPLNPQQPPQKQPEQHHESTPRSDPEHPLQPPAPSRSPPRPPPVSSSSDNLTLIEREFLQQNSRFSSRYRDRQQPPPAASPQPPLDPRYQHSRLPAVYERQPQEEERDRFENREPSISRLASMPTLGAASGRSDPPPRAKKRTSWLAHQAGKMAKTR